MGQPQFKAAFPYQKDVLALPGADLDTAAQWYSKHLAVQEVEHFDQPLPTVILEAQRYANRIRH